MAKDNIIQGSFGPKKIEPGPYAAPAAGNPNPGDPRQPSPPTFAANTAKDIKTDPAEPGTDQTGIVLLGHDGKPIPVVLSEQQQKAFGLVVSGMPFVIIAIRPTDRGADFLTAVHGDKGDLRNASDHFPDLIHRALQRAGVL